MSRTVLFPFTIQGVDFDITDDIVNDVVWLNWNDNGQWKSLNSRITEESMDVMLWLQTLADRFNPSIQKKLDDLNPNTPLVFADWQDEARYRIANNLQIVNGQLTVSS